MALLLFAVLPMFPYYYFWHSSDYAWPLQIIILSLLWAWDPWLKPYAAKVYLCLGSAFGFYYISTQNDSLSISMAILILTVLTSQLRTQVFKLPQNLIKALIL